jgi:hypothetical protein
VSITQYLISEEVTREYAVSGMPDLRPEDGTYFTVAIRPHTVIVEWLREDDGSLRFLRAEVRANRVLKSGGLGSVTVTVILWANLLRDLSWFREWLASITPTV